MSRERTSPRVCMMQAMTCTVSISYAQTLRVATIAVVRFLHLFREFRGRCKNFVFHTHNERVRERIGYCHENRFVRMSMDCANSSYCAEICIRWRCFLLFAKGVPDPFSRSNVAMENVPDRPKRFTKIRGIKSAVDRIKFRNVY